MLRHVIAPRRAFSQIPNAITRNRRLGSHAKNLLIWQLSLPADAEDNLSDTAREAGLRKSAFQEGKRQLMTEGYVHQWKVRTRHGRIATVQLVSNTPLTAEEAAAVRDGRRTAPGVVRVSGGAGEPPTDTPPAVGEPTPQAVGRLPKKNTRENTSPPTPPEPEAPAEPETPAGPDGPAGPQVLVSAECFLRSLVHAEPRLALSARKARELAPLAAPWLDCGLPSDQIRHALVDGMAGARSPIGALRWRLENALPDVPPPPVPGPRPEPRVTRMRECRTRHDQPRLFTPPPGSDEDRCPDCRTEPEETARTPDQPDGTGYAAFVAARLTHCPSPRKRRAARAA